MATIERTILPPPHKPLLIYDGQCGFCRYWILHWQWMTGASVDYLAFQDPLAEFPDIPREAFARSVYLIEPSGEVYKGAAAVFRALAHMPGRRWPLWLYRHVPGVAPLAEGAYGFVSRHRSGLEVATKWLWGRKPQLPTFYLSRWLFLRLLGLVYLTAFISIWSQIHGLIGRFGILPVRDALITVGSRYGVERYWLYPTLAWLGSSDFSLNLMCGFGVICAILLIFRYAPALMLFCLWALYLSVSVVGQIFMNYQWDVLLLECGFLAMFLAPWRWRPGPIAGEPAPSLAVLWLERWLLFRLLFCSGMVKLLGGDPSWRNLTALYYHFETQPLPTWLGWFLHHLPHTAPRLLTFLLLFVELVVPFLIFLPRRPRRIAFYCLAAQQVITMLIGNYAFFSWINLALCLLLLDDPFLRSLLPKRLAPRLTPDLAHPSRPLIQRGLIVVLAPLVLLISLAYVVGMFRGGWMVPRALGRVVECSQPFRSINAYGLFAVMTKSRPEIVIEGSNDNETWVEYEFKWKPGDLTRRPECITPHQPRLDWQMWFAALEDYEQNPWLIQFMSRLLEGSPPVLRLLRKNPFEDHPPQYIRAVLYEYHFSDWQAWRGEGRWWWRERMRDYAPVITLRERNTLLEAKNGKRSNTQKLARAWL